MEPSNNRHIGDEHFVHCSEAVPSLDVEMYIGAGGEQFVHCREVVHSSECPLSEKSKIVVCCLVFHKAAHYSVLDPF